MTIAGLFLLGASVLKIHQLLTEPVISKGFWESWEFFLIQIPLELGLGVWLVSGLFRKAAWLLAVLAFGLFIGVTLQKGLTGAESCGCFGRVHVNPWVTLSAVDIPLFVLLLFFQPKGLKLLPPPWPAAKHFFGVAIPTFLLLAVVEPVLIFNKPPEKTDKYEVVKPQDWTVKQPATEPQTTDKEPVEKTVAEEWPMLKHIDIADSLKTGIAVVLLYHFDCPTCREAIPMYDQMCRDLSGGEDAIRFAFVEIPPYCQNEDSPIPPGTTCLTGKLDSSKEWYIATPLVVLIQDGSVIKSWEAVAPEFDEILTVLSAAQ